MPSHREVLRRKLTDLDGLIPESQGWFADKRLSNWRDFSAMAKEIQTDFNEGFDVPREDRQELWREFNEIRDRAREQQKDEWEGFVGQSERLRAEIIDECA